MRDYAPINASYLECVREPGLLFDLDLGDYKVLKGYTGILSTFLVNRTCVLWDDSLNTDSAEDQVIMFASFNYTMRRLVVVPCWEPEDSEMLCQAEQSSLWAQSLYALALAIRVTTCSRAQRSHHRASGQYVSIAADVVHFLGRWRGWNWMGEGAEWGWDWCCHHCQILTIFLPLFSSLNLHQLTSVSLPHSPTRRPSSLCSWNSWCRPEERPIGDSLPFSQGASSTYLAKVGCSSSLLGRMQHCASGTQAASDWATHQSRNELNSVFEKEAKEVFTTQLAPWIKNTVQGEVVWMLWGFVSSHSR